MLFGMHIKNGRRVIPSQFFNTLLCLLVLTLKGTVAYAEQAPLTLANALSRAMAQNPTLQVFDFRLQGLEGRRFSADQNPALEAGLEVENVLGSGNRQGSDAAEYTLSLSSVLELGGKRQARVSVVDSRYGLVEAERRAETLDVLGQVAQRFVIGCLGGDVAKLTEEIRQHGDIVVTGDPDSTPSACIEKSFAWWAFALTAFPRAAYIAKTDDDSLNNFGNLLDILNAPSITGRSGVPVARAVVMSAVPSAAFRI